MARGDTPLTVTIERMEGHRAVLLFPGNQRVSVSRRFVPKSAKVGDELTIDFFTHNQAIKRQENIARAILEEILGEG
jgi:hypothetical protein